MIRILAISLILLSFCAILLLAQAPPSPADINSPAHEVQRLRLLSGFQKALLAQAAAQQAQAAFESARQQYTDLADRTAEELGMAKGSEFRIDASAGRVTIIAPPSPPPAAAPPKPPEPASAPPPEAPKQ